MKNKRSYTKHGLTKTKDYLKWIDMKSRCYGKNNEQYRDWGGRGIKVCDDWKDSPVDFIDYIRVLENYGVGNYSLDRIDNDRDYEPGNLRWVDRHTQSCNQRKQKNNTSGYTGVYQNRKSYVSRIWVNRKCHRIGISSTLEEAVKLRNDYIIKNNLTEYEIQEYQKNKN